MCIYKARQDIQSRSLSPSMFKVCVSCCLQARSPPADPPHPFTSVSLMSSWNAFQVFHPCRIGPICEQRKGKRMY